MALKSRDDAKPLFHDFQIGRLFFIVDVFIRFESRQWNLKEDALNIDLSACSDDLEKFLTWLDFDVFSLVFA